MSPCSHSSEDYCQLIARRFSVLGEPMRLRILMSVLHREHSVAEIVDQVGSTQANVSRHLQILSSEGFLSRRKQGTQVYYSNGDEALEQLCLLAGAGLWGQLPFHHGALQENSVHAAFRS